MRRSPRTRSLAAAVGMGSPRLAVLVAQRRRSPRQRRGRPPTAAGHKCLVMTGSGDPAFIKNFNPYAGGGLPSSAFVQGAFYEPLIVTCRRAASSRSRGSRAAGSGATATRRSRCNLAPNAKWSDGKPLTSADVVYSLTAGRQDKAMDRIGLVGAGNNIASIKAKGAHTVVIKLKTPDSQFIAATLNRAFVVPKHIWSKVKRSRDVHEPEPGRLRPVQP